MAKDKIQSFLKEWITNYIKNKDLMLRNIETIEDKDDFIEVKYKDKEQQIFTIPSLKTFNFLEQFKKEDHYLLVIFNTRDNFNKIIDNWQKLIEFKFLCIYFVNPWSSLDKKWIIYPYTHHQIADESSLKTGLKSMFDMVEPVTESHIKKINT